MEDIQEMEHTVGKVTEEESMNNGENFQETVSEMQGEIKSSGKMAMKLLETITETLSYWTMLKLYERGPRKIGKDEEQDVVLELRSRLPTEGELMKLRAFTRQAWRHIDDNDKSFT